MSQLAGEFAVRVEQVDGFDFIVRFDKDSFEPVRLDEPPPLGHDHAPNAARYLAAAVGNCLAASLVYCAKRAGHALTDVTASVKVTLVRNEQRRLRIGHIGVSVVAPGASEPALAGCLASFEDFCVVTQSVRHGIDVEVAVNGRPTASHTSSEAASFSASG
jgi:uncharacterized OsmC-like protein